MESLAATAGGARMNVVGGKGGCGHLRRCKGEGPGLHAPSPPSLGARSMGAVPRGDAIVMGRTLNHYEIIEQIGAGGMGKVYRARDTSLGREVALKLLPNEWMTDVSRRQRFQREAKALAAISHPNIVAVYSLEEAEGVLFITMELVRGKLLSALMRARGMPLEKFFALAIPLTEAVGHAHEAGITHRDLKPTNIMVDEEGRLRVLDFGLAKTSVPPASLGSTTIPVEPPITADGRIVGTAAYMSPEQAQGMPLDQRSDVFSLGILLYELLTGERPFKGDTQISTISSILKDTPPSVTDLKRSLPRHLARIIRRCLAKEPGRRYASARELCNELRELRDEIDSGELLAGRAIAAPRRSRRPWRAILGVGALVVLIAVLALTGTLEFGDAPVRQSEVMEIEVDPITHSGTNFDVAISPDGKYVACVERTAGKLTLLVRHRATGGVVTLVPATDDKLTFPRISSSGNYVYYLRAPRGARTGTIYEMPILGGVARRLFADVAGPLDLSADGRQIGFFRHSPEHLSLVVAPVDGSSEQVIAQTIAHQPGILAWSPDGTRIIADDYDPGPPARGHLIEIELDKGEIRRFSATTWTWIFGGTWLPDGSGIVVAGLLGSERWEQFGDLWLLPYPKGEPRPLTSDSHNYSCVTAAPAIKALCVRQGDSERFIWVAPMRQLDQGHSFRIDSRVAQFTPGVAWTRDGHLLYEAREGNDVHIWVTDAEGHSPRRLTSEGPLNGWASVSPDGRSIAYYSTRSGSSEIWIDDIEGGNPRRLTDDLFGGFFPEFSPDGEWIFYNTIQEGRYHIRKVRRSGGPSIRVTDFSAVGTSFSPDGRYLLCTTRDASKQRPCDVLVPIEGGPPIDTLQTAWGRWTPDGEGVAFVRSEGGASNIYIQPVAGGEPSQLTEFSEGHIHSFAWSWSGDSLAVVRSRSKADVVLVRGCRVSD